MAGQRQPIELLLAKGKKNLTKKEIEERQAREVKANSDNISPPDYLPENLKNQFNYIANELIEIGIMSNLDCEALARYIVLEYQYQTVTKKILSINIEDDEYYQFVNLQEKLFKQVRSIANDLGLSISSRCKLVIPKVDKENKEETLEDKLFGGL